MLNSFFFNYYYRFIRGAVVHHIRYIACFPSKNGHASPVAKDSIRVLLKYLEHLQKNYEVRSNKDKGDL